MFDRRPNSNKARICVLGFSANRVWLVSRFYNFYVIFCLHYYKERAFSIPTVQSDAVIGPIQLLVITDEIGPCSRRNRTMT